ncbi:hypothetical protein A3724_16835 [Alcanivorax sp. HI0033]|nr:hypothetical protein A3713_14685 [Alcanivorax sp. HI0003]KZX72481.1 hypothetical protein A3714_16715 [Alcanivorax sp. HI0007]KZX74056.1 hypothetical protein A3717_15285 [Alcanivorax sp. HI0013]KZX85154.1 hypothetical protein A3716_15650 [Alcanivorax sp. HI0011]KZY09184.1 hypothetical protein A3724_16835 [Alcanivorax sp. HI0033]KZY19957.1 hypothetical protein A3725_08055 [Alcanivorax sp. HI0035]
MNWRSDPKKSSFIDTENELDEIDRFSLTWNKIYSQNFDRDNILFVTHEELCSEPLTSLKKMADFCGISWSEKFDKFIDENMVGGVVEKTKGQLHNFKRDSKSLAKAWVDKVSVEDEKRIKDITGEVVERIYGQWK